MFLFENRLSGNRRD